jgi:hypothetical protein
LSVTVLEPTTGRNWLRMLGRFLLASAIGNLASEVVQFPLYTLWHTGTAYEIALMVLHCAAGDVLIAFVAVVAALLAVGSPSWPEQRFAAVMLGTVAARRRAAAGRPQAAVPACHPGLGRQCLPTAPTRG